MTDPIPPSPQAVIANIALAGKGPRREDESQTAFALRQVAADSLDKVCDMLDAYEEQQGVVFMALPRETLEWLRTVWESGDDPALEAVSVRILRDLFNGQDGHLHRIDANLGAR